MKKRVYCTVLAFLICTMAMITWFPVNSLANEAIELNEVDDSSVLLYDKIIMGVGDVYDPVFRYDVGQYYVFSLNSNVLSVSMDGSAYRIVAESVGTATILINYYNQDGILDSCTCEITVLEEHAALNDEKYYFYSEARRFLIAGSDANRTAYIQRWETRNDTDAAWEFTPSGKYYYIHHSALMAYLGVDDNDQLDMYAAWEKTPTLWRLFVDASGRTVIVPKDHEHTNLAVGTNGTSAYLADYFSDVSTKRWHVVTQSAYLDNYHDSSAMQRLDGSQYNAVRCKIPEANTFVTSVFSSVGVTIRANGNPSRIYGLLADSCPLGNNQACNSTCAVAHKNANLIFNEISTDIPRDYRHVTVLWADRTNLVYSGLDNAEGDVAAMTRQDMTEHVPALSFFTITKMRDGTITNGDEIQTVMSISLAHEVAHIYGIEGDPAEDMVDEYGNKIHSTQYGVTCIMNYMSFDEMKDYYKICGKNGVPYFCDDCLAILLEEAPKVVHIGN